MRDIFRPHHEPAISIYDAFQAEASRRSGRTVEEWMLAERKAVWSAARDAAQQRGLCIPTMAEVERVERSACGHLDYGLKWALGISEIMKKGAEHGE